jgi:heme A synthase
VVVLVQLALGALLRHTYVRSGPRWHLLGAFAVLAAVVWLAGAVWASEPARRRLGRTVSVLVLLVAVQLALGVEAWLSKFSQGFFLELQPAPTLPQVVIRTAHFLLGSCILAAAVVTIVLARWSVVPVGANAMAARESLSQPRPLMAGVVPARLERTA